MKRYINKGMQTVIFAIKIILYVSLLISFLLLFSINNRAVLIPSRTMATTIFVFCTVEMLMIAIYGKFDIGRKKSKTIIYSMFLATVVTDIVTYLQIMIMNTITPSVGAFKLSDIGTLIITIFAHLLIVTVFAYLGNGIYFWAKEPEKCVIITSADADISQIISGISKYRKQYKITRIVDYKRSDLQEIVRECDTVFLCSIPDDIKEELVSFCYEQMKNIYLSPEIPDIIENVAEHYLLDDISFLNANITRMTFEQRFIKRMFDILLSLVVGIVSSPFWLVSAIAIKLNDGGKILFKQKRMTLNGKVFEVYKFRTMKENVENRSATEDDDRITKVGKVLRKTRLDEIPQILNILKGDMSFVGPRPEMLENVYAYTENLPEFKYRLRAKAGLTGYAQIAGKYNTSPKDKLILDIMYIEKYSIWTDIKLLFQTAIVLLKSDSTEGFHNKDSEYIVEETPEHLKV